MADLMRTLVAGLGGQRSLSGTSRPSRWLMDMFGGGMETHSGASVTPESSMQLASVFAAVQCIAGDVGSTPCLVYHRRGDGGRDRARQHRMWRPLHEQPNEFHSADEFWEIITAHVLLWGNAYAAKVRGVDGLVKELIPLRPDLVHLTKDRHGKPVYVYTTHDGKQVTAGPDEVLHFRGLGTDGREGLSPIRQARHALGNALTLQEFQGRFWRNNAAPGGVLKHPGVLNEKAQKRLRVTWDVLHGGIENAGKAAILEEGMDWQQLGMPLADAQFIEQARFSRSEIALIFQLPPYKLAADSGGSMRYENVEAQGIDYARSTLKRWFSRFEGALKRDPDLFLQAQAYYPEFLMDAWMRGDSKSRSEFYAKALDPTKGWMTRDEVRTRENLNPLTDEQRAELAELAKLAAKTAKKNDDEGEAESSQGGGGA